MSPSWLAALLQLNEAERYSSSLPSIGGKLLLTECGREAQNGHMDFAVTGGQSPIECFIDISDATAYLHITLGWSLYVEYHF